ncbi:MAG: hypothetical protein ACRETQ_01870 [Gammaproteobacteria bacterium]
MILYHVRLIPETLWDCRFDARQTGIFIRTIYKRDARHGAILANVMLGNYTAVIAAHAEQDWIRKFYCEVLGCKIRVNSDAVDRFQLGEFHFCFVWQNAALSDGDFMKAIYLELKADQVEEMQQKILGFGVKRLDVPDLHLYFQAPGGQVFRIVGANEDLSAYEGSLSSRPGSPASANQG